LKIETIDRDDHQKQITAEFEPEVLERFKHQAARKISQETKIPGFRPGKAPYDMVRRLYGDKAIQEQAISLMLEDVYPEVIKEAAINPFGPGQLEEIVSVEPLILSFVVPLAPEVVLGDYRAIREAYTPPTITPERVDQVVQSVLRRSGTAEAVERPSQQGDMVAIKLSAKLINPDEGQDADLITESTQEMVAGTPEEHTDNEGREWPYTGFSSELVGLVVGDTRTITYTFPENEDQDDLNGKEAEFNFTVESVKEVTLPELNDEFAQTMGQYETVDDFRKSVEQQLNETELRNYNNKYIEGLISTLVDSSSVKYPSVALDEEIEHILHHFEERLAQDHTDLETYFKARQITREEMIEKEVKQVAEKNLKRQYALEEFSVRENIQIKQEEINMVYDMAASQAKRDSELQGLTRGKMNPRELTDTLARSTINEIFNQRLVSRLRSIATGEADAPAVEIAETPAEVIEPAVEAEVTPPSDESAAPLSE
jgi:trigger factor